jgi:hypothetical protein
MKEETQMLREAAMEIKNLRRQNELMAARLDVFDSMMAVLHTPIAMKSQGMSPDLVWEIEKYLDKQPQTVTN